MKANRVFFILFSIAMLSAAAYVWLQPELAFPARRSGKTTYFAGLSQFFFGLSPLLAGLSAARNATMPEVRKEPVCAALALAGICSMMAAALLAQKF